jgi:hypothetical protein
MIGLEGRKGERAREAMRTLATNPDLEQNAPRRAFPHTSQSFSRLAKCAATEINLTHARKIVNFRDLFSGRAGAHWRRTEVPARLWRPRKIARLRLEAILRGARRVDPLPPATPSRPSSSLVGLWIRSRIMEISLLAKGWL